MEKSEILICECHSPEHQILFLWDDNDDCPCVYMQIHLNKLSFWQRLKYGVKYIFGYKCRYGAFDEVILKASDADKLKRIIEFLKHGKEDTRV